MTYKVEITHRAEKDLKAIPHKDGAKIHAAIIAMTTDLKGDIKKLANRGSEYRLRVGNWRVLFEIENDSIVIARILDRKEAYRK